MMRVSTSAWWVARIIVGASLAGLAAITLLSPGATRMHAWPWTLAYATALIGPAVLLVFRGLRRDRPLVLPGASWTFVVSAWVCAVLASAWFSPYRAQSLNWAAPLLAGPALFLVLYDALQRDPSWKDALIASLRVGGAVVALASVLGWVGHVWSNGFSLEARNPHPLGHSNYTAGLALWLMPLAVPTARATSMGRRLALVIGILACLMLFTSGSRGGWVGLMAMALAGLGLAAIPPRRKFQLAALVAGVALAGAWVHPRMRGMLLSGDGAERVAASDVQRSAMLDAAARMGWERPLFGWGPGTTPLVYPLYRGELSGGAENVLQLHSLPAQIWAEIGGAGLLVLLLAAVVVWRAAGRHPVVGAASVGYGFFSLFDWQLDVPVFAAAAAVAAALLASAGRQGRAFDSGKTLGARWASRAVAGLAVAALALVAIGGRSDPTPELNARALLLAREKGEEVRAIEMLRASLDLNPDQEIAHFNLGWLLLTRDSAAAERHFRESARLVPDKGGVYFGIGLARFNQGSRESAARALALECVNDPAFLFSPWWREPALAPLRDAAAGHVSFLLRRVAEKRSVPAGLRADLLGQVPAGPERIYRRERTGYPVLMRNLDFDPPVDLYDVREPAVPPRELAGLPAKGWLEGPRLRELLEASGPSTR